MARGPRSTRQPSIAVVIPTYNRSELLALTLRSLANQRFSSDDFEVVVADDGSTDATIDVVDSFRPHLRLKYHFQPDLGFRAGTARNAGARLASAPVLAFLDNGTLAGPDFVRTHLGAHASGGRAVMGYTYGYREADDPTPSVPYAAHSSSAPDPQELVDRHGSNPSFWDGRHVRFAEVDFDMSRHDVPWLLFWTTNVSMRNDDFWAVGGFDESFYGYGAEDIDLAFRLHRRAVPFMVSREAWAVELPQAHSASDVTSNYRNIRKFLSKHRDPALELWSALIAAGSDAPGDLENAYREVLDWTRAAAGLDVADEIKRAMGDLREGGRAAVFGCGGSVPGELADGVLVDFDPQLLKAVGAGRADATHHAIGIYTDLPAHAVDLVIITSRLGGLWPRWGKHILAEANRVGRVTVGPPLGESAAGDGFPEARAAGTLPPGTAS